MIVDNTEIVKVKIADMAVLKDNGLIITVGLGSCVGICLYDEISRVGGLAHILLAESQQFKSRDGAVNKAKFADTAIPLLLEKMEKFGGKRSRLRSKIAGGSQLFVFKKTNISVGEKNVETVRRTLKKLNIPVVGEDVGGSHGRTMRLYIDSGRVTISTVGKGEIEI
ncbi:MAG: chemotaxis protein CheD [Bacillota bacterium]